MSTEPKRTCPSCGNEFSGAMEFCPVCMLRKGLAGGVESGESSFEQAVKETPEQPTKRFEHYELVMGEDGKPVELGRGAMGVTYKALDVDLRRPVTLKVISERYLGDESARLRFLREARAAASVRHSNVASVLHLGRTGSGYFYAVEFVEGETLENLVRRSGRLEVKLALEIAMQVAAGLAAIHEQNLVHRDIKPTNIMVRLKEERSVTAKIIDLGLAKTLEETASEAGISSPGAFVGTPEFASPKQFGGVGVDIRSDLYSLGVTLWVMVTGQTPFRGPPAEVMYQHQHAPLPLERLKDVTQPVVVLLEKLLEKDPAQRFRTPNELLKAIPTVTDAIDQVRRITRHSLQKDALDGSACRNSQAASKTCTRQDFCSQIARYREQCLWARGGYFLPGCCLGEPANKRRNVSLVSGVIKTFPKTVVSPPSRCVRLRAIFLCHRLTLIFYYASTNCSILYSGSTPGTIPNYGFTAFLSREPPQLLSLSGTGFAKMSRKREPTITIFSITA
jgi:serine/threonine protein kinase